MDAVISSHYLEHCENPFDVLDGMIAALNPNGRIYLSFPSEASVGFPSRHGSLCFRDDPTHQFPPRWEQVLRHLEERNMTIGFAAPLPAHRSPDHRCSA